MHKLKKSKILSFFEGTPPSKLPWALQNANHAALALFDTLHPPPHVKVQQSPLHGSVLLGWDFQTEIDHILYSSSYVAYFSPNVNNFQKIAISKVQRQFGRFPNFHSYWSLEGGDIP